MKWFFYNHLLNFVYFNTFNSDFSFGEANSWCTWPEFVTVFLLLLVDGFVHVFGMGFLDYVQNLD